MYYTLEQIGELVKPTWSEFLFVGTVVSIKSFKSSAGNDYDHVLVRDHTGLRVLFNCNQHVLEVSKNYTFKVRASINQRTNIITCFLLEKTDLFTSEVFKGEPCLDDKITNMIKSQIYLTLNEISEITSNSFETLLDEPSVVENPRLLKLKDSEDRVYYYRLWPDDPELSKDELAANSILKFEFPTLFKKEASSAINLNRNKFTRIQVEID